MNRRAATSIFVTLGGIVFFLIGSRVLSSVQDATPSNSGFAAVRGERGGQDADGPYEVVADWPKPMSQLPGHENWTWGTINGIFAESANRVFVLRARRTACPEETTKYPDSAIRSESLISGEWRAISEFRARSSL